MLIRTCLFAPFFLGTLKSQFPALYSELLEDLETFRNFVLDHESFGIVWALLERKYQEERVYTDKGAKDEVNVMLSRTFL